MIRLVQEMKKSAGSDNNTVEMQDPDDKRTIVRDERSLVSLSPAMDCFLFYIKNTDGFETHTE